MTANIQTNLLVVDMRNTRFSCSAHQVWQNAREGLVPVNTTSKISSSELPGRSRSFALTHSGPRASSPARQAFCSLLVAISLHTPTTVGLPAHNNANAAKPQARIVCE